MNEQIGATAMSRLPAGMLLVPSELSFGSPMSEPPDTGANIAGDAFQGELIQVITAAVDEAGSASRVTPMVVRGRAEYLKEIRLIDFARDMDATFAAMREELLRMIASGLDIPAEILTGLADLNHWSLWGVEESAAKMHIDPDVLLILDSITRGYLWPALNMGEEGRRFVIWRDFADLTSRPINLEQAQQMLDRNVVNADYVRRIANAGEDDAPDDEMPSDYAQKITSSGELFRAGFKAESILASLGLPPIEHTGLAPITLQRPEDAASIVEEPTAPAGPDNVEIGPPPEPAPEVIVASGGLALTSLADIDRTLADRIIEASEGAFARALERAGAKIRLAAKKDRTITSQIDGLPNSKVTYRLGPGLTEQLQLTEDQLLPQDTFDPLKDRVTKLVTDAQEARRKEVSTILGFEVTEKPEEEDDRDLAIALFIAALFQVASLRLFTPGPDPDPAETGEFSDTLVNGEMVYSLLTTAGGGGADIFFTPETPRGLALGQRTRASLIDNGFLITSETWQYGYPSVEFPPHRALNGLAFESREAPSLRVSPVYAWLGNSFYYPGDHEGCRCQIVPTVEASGLS